MAVIRNETNENLLTNQYFQTLEKNMNIEDILNSDNLSDSNFI